jgi:glycine hydroxymethyltransferase
MNRGEKLICDGTINHLVMWDLRPHGLTGSKVEKILDLMHITTNKNSVVGDKSAVNPGGIRLGTPALTTRGMNEEHMDMVADFLVRSIKVALVIQEKSGKKLVDFVAGMNESEDLKIIAEEVTTFAKQFSIPGV